MNEEQEASFLRSCRNFNGIKNERCKAGMSYMDLRSIGGAVCQCLGRRPPTGLPSPQPCPKFEAHTQADLEADRAIEQAALERMAKVEPIIKAIKARRFEAGAMMGRISGVEVCPVCGGELHYRLAVCNGHLRMNCKTAGCIHMIE